MSIFGFNRTSQATVARGVHTVRKGIAFLQVSEFDNALREFRSVSASRNPKTTRLVRSVAEFYAYNTEVLRKEVKKQAFGNANLIEIVPGNARNAWSDVDIAAVLIAPATPGTTAILAGTLGRTPEAIRFQRRYATEQPLQSWEDETGARYTRYTQTRRVAQRLGLV